LFLLISFDFNFNENDFNCEENHFHFDSNHLKMIINYHHSKIKITIKSFLIQLL